VIVFEQSVALGFKDLNFIFFRGKETILPLGMLMGQYCENISEVIDNL
jgi:hypothetical protein